MSVTIVDIAKEVGVSRTTVSNILNGVYKCTEETKIKVINKAKEMGYRPNMAAKTLVKNTSNLIGVIFPSYLDKNLLTGNPFYNLVIDGINSTLMENAKYDLIINCISQKQENEKIIDWIGMRNIDGLIIIGEIDNKIIQEIQKEKVPMVLIDNYIFKSDNEENILFLNTEDEKGINLSTNYLINKGYKKIGFCSSYIDISTVNTLRYEGYKKALKSKNLKEYIFETESIFFEEGLKIAEKIIESKIDSLVCTGDVLALGLIKGLGKFGKKVPQDIAIIGFDNIDMSSQFIPSLTTINQDIFGRGKESVNLLLGMIKKHKFENNKIIMPVNLIERESS